MPTTFDVPDLHCPACARSVTAAVLAAEPGATVNVDVPARRVTVAPVGSAARIAQAIEDAGFTVATKS